MRTPFVDESAELCCWILCVSSQSSRAASTPDIFALELDISLRWDFKICESHFVEGGDVELSLAVIKERVPSQTGAASPGGSSCCFL